MKTVFEEKNKNFSDKAHLAAQIQVYPRIFGTPDIQFEDVTLSNGDERSRIYDAEMAVDRILHVATNDFKKPLSFTVQERFRRTNYRNKYQDITITEWNHASNQPSELHKLTGGMFLYGYYDDAKNKITQYVMFSSAAVVFDILRKRLCYKRASNRKNQTFISIKFDDLRKNGLIISEWEDTE